MTQALAQTRSLTALDVCDRCGAQAYVRVLLVNSRELLFCGHHGRLYAEALATVAVEIHDESPQREAATALAAAIVSASPDLPEHQDRGRGRWSGWFR